VVLSAVLVCALAGCSGGATPQETGFATNAAGDTYGSAQDAQSSDDEPDLIAALATNGVEGYVRKSDLYAGEPQNPEDAVAYQNARDDTAVLACLGTVGVDLGRDLSDDDRTLVRQVMDAWVADTLATDGAAALTGLLQAAGADASAIADLPGAAERCALAAMESQTRTIAVYEADGTTVVGEFVIGAP